MKLRPLSTRKAQLMGQPIILIFTLIVAVLLLTWGVTSIFKLKTTASKAQLSITIKDLRDLTTEYYAYEEGSSREISLSVPEKATYFCFVDQDETLATQSQIDKYETGLKKLIDISNENLFILPLKDFGDYNIPNLKPGIDSPNPLCIRTQGRLNAIIENKITHVEIYLKK